MGCLVHLTAILGLLPASAPPAPPANGNEAQRIIERAIEAAGGRARLSQCRTFYLRMAGHFYYSGAPDAFTAEVYGQDPDQNKAIIKGKLSGSPYTLTQVYNRGQCWVQEDGVMQTVDPSTVADMKVDLYVDHLVTLLPLLDDKGLSITVAASERVNDVPADVLLVRSKGYPEVQFFFDHQQGYLIKTAYRGKDPATDRDSLREEYYRDYRDFQPGAADEKVLEAAHIATDHPSLLEFLHQRSLDDTRKQILRKLVQQLGDASYTVRQKAGDDLVAAGSAALPLLTAAQKDPDPEIARHAADCVQRILQATDGTTPASVVRLLAFRRPAGVVETLLAYLPSAPNDTVRHEVELALAAVAVHDGKPDPALVGAQEDKDPRRRAVALRILKEIQDPAGPVTRLYPLGARFSMHGIKYENGKKTIDWKVAELQFFNRLDDSVFAKP